METKIFFWIQLGVEGIHGLVCLYFYYYRLKERLLLQFIHTSSTRYSVCALNKGEISHEITRGNIQSWLIQFSQNTADTTATLSKCRWPKAEPLSDPSYGAAGENVCVCLYSLHLSS